MKTFSGRTNEHFVCETKTKLYNIMLTIENIFPQSNCQWLCYSAAAENKQTHWTVQTGSQFVWIFRRFISIVFIMNTFRFMTFHENALKNGNDFFNMIFATSNQIIRRIGDFRIIKWPNSRSERYSWRNCDLRAFLLFSSLPLEASFVKCIVRQNVLFH